MNLKRLLIFSVLVSPVPARAGITSIFTLPVGPPGSIQINDGGVFFGSGTLTYVNGYVKLSTPAIGIIFPDGSTQTVAGTGNAIQNLSILGPVQEASATIRALRVVESGGDGLHAPAEIRSTESNYPFSGNATLDLFTTVTASTQNSVTISFDAKNDFGQQSYGRIKMESPFTSATVGECGRMKIIPLVSPTGLLSLIGNSDFTVDGCSATSRITGTLEINNSTNTRVTLTVNGISGQSADLQDWNDSNGIVLSSIDKLGNLGVPTATASTSTIMSRLNVPEISIKHLNGNISYYTAASNSDLSRGTALLNATKANGDSIYLSANTFDLGSSVLRLSVAGSGRINLYGSGRDVTTIKTSADSSGLQAGIQIDNGAEVADLTIQNTNDASFNTAYPIGNGGATNNANNVILRNLKVSGVSDGIFAGGTKDGFDVRFCVVISSWDGISALATNSKINVYDSTVTVIGPSPLSGTTHALYSDASGAVINSFNNILIATGISTNYGAGTGDLTSNGTINIYGGTINTDLSGTDLRNNGTAINITANTIYNPSKILGTISFADTNQIKFSLGLSTTMLQANIYPKYKAGTSVIIATDGPKSSNYFQQVGTARFERWYYPSAPYGGGTTTAGPLTAGRLYISPVIFQRDGTIDKVGFSLTAASATYHVRCGFYDSISDIDLYGNNLLMDSGDISTTGTGLHTATVTFSVTANKLYWSAYFVEQPITTTAVSQTSSGMFNILGFANTLTGTAGSNIVVDTTYGSLPNPFPAGGSVAATSIPQCAVRFSQ